MDFSVFAYQFTFEALDEVFFAPGMAGNVFRGAFGVIFRRIACVPTCPGTKRCELRDQCAYARMFEPSFTPGPSGLADAPRPFVLRAATLDGRRIAAGSEFAIDVHVFDLVEPALPYFVLSFAQLAREGLGAGRRRVSLRKVDTLNEQGKPELRVFDDNQFQLRDAPRRIRISLAPHPSPIAQLEVSFVTPTELKSEGRLRGEPEFGVLFARIRDRISTLRQLYGEGPLEIDFRGMAERANGVRLTHSELRWESHSRRSSRTGQVHPLGGFTGKAHYEGELAEFVPYLEAARWTGVGRQTVWGKGELRISSYN